jgi:hypothetical protein
MFSRGKGPARRDTNYGQEPQRAMFNAGFPRMDLTTFRGDNPRGWLRRCNKFFKLNATPWQQWVEIASLYLEGKAEIWFEGYMCGLDVSLEWEEFSKAICSRFGSRDDIVEEFNKLTQEGGMEEYVERFEELKSLMHSLNPLLPESYYISSFISGLKEDIKPMLKILKPGTLMTAFDQAKWQEESNNILARKSRFTTKPVMGGQGGRSFGNQQSNYVSNNSQTPKVSETMYEQRRRLGQCFKCGDKFMPGHKCIAKGLNMIEGQEEEEFMDAATGNNSAELAPDSKIEEYGLSLNALADNYAHNTIRIRGSYQGRDLIILIDSGSTHSFIDASVARELQLSAGHIRTLFSKKGRSRRWSKRCYATTSFSQV